MHIYMLGCEYKSGLSVFVVVFVLTRRFFCKKQKKKMSAAPKPPNQPDLSK